MRHERGEGEWRVLEDERVDVCREARCEVNSNGAAEGLTVEDLLELRKERSEEDVML
jgi:hypothetical protein